VKSPIKVIVRTRPTPNIAVQNIHILESKSQIEINVPKNEAQGIINHQQESWKFKFDKVLYNKSQAETYEGLEKELLKSSLKGYSGTVLCYGQTSAGKTHTMIGDQSDVNLRGIIPRVIESLFSEIQTKNDKTITFKVSYAEIYNETIVDLFNPTSSENITINEHSKKGIFLKGLTHKVCNTQQEALQHLMQGEINRTVASTAMNSKSSRSHAIFTIYLEIKPKVELGEKIVYSKINLVDLAGSERTKKTKSEGKTLVEANHINKSLFFLEQMVNALSEKQREHVPYRHSKLTYLLKDSIGGNSKTIMIANIFPEAANLDETISTLKFATRMMKVSNEAQINVKMDSQGMIKKYEKELKQLRQELAYQNLNVDKKLEKYTTDEKNLQYKIAKKYLKEGSGEIQIDSVAHAQLLFKQFRKAHRVICKTMKNRLALKQMKSLGSEIIGGGEEKELSIIHKKMRKTKSVSKRSSIGKMMPEVDMKNYTSATDFSGDDSNRKSFYVCSLNKINDYERNEIFSQSTFEEKETMEESNMDNKNKTFDYGFSSMSGLGSGKQSPLTHDELLSFKTMVQKSLVANSLQSIQDISPKNRIQSENEMQAPKKNVKAATDKLKALKFTIQQINRNIYQANSMLHRQFDVYKRHGVSALSVRTVTEDNFNMSHRSDASISQSFISNTHSMILGHNHGL